MTKVIFPTDEHHPYANPKALSVAMQIAEDFEPDLRIAGSDAVDFYSLSNFNKDPGRIKAGGLQNEINAWAKSQRAWKDATPNADVKFIEGNHEDRLRRWLWKNPELHGLDALKLENVMLFDELDITMVPGGEIILHDRVRIAHGSRISKHSAYTAKAEMVDEVRFEYSSLTGHTHRGGTIYFTKRNGWVEGMECFCLCDLDPEYVTNPNWQNGIVLATVTKDWHKMEPVPFFELGGRLRARWRGKEYVD